jgi:hypothetical protein
MRNWWLRHLLGAADPSAEPSQGLFTSTNLNGGYWPFRGLFVSLVSHSSVLIGMTLVAILTTEPPPVLTTRLVMIDVREMRDETFLPQLEAEYPSMTSPAQPVERPREEPKEPTVSRHPSPKGRSYPGPQLIRSDVQEPTNPIQTILQPALKNPPRLELLPALPNIVLMAPPKPILPVDSLGPVLTPPGPLTAAPPPLIPQPLEAPKIAAPSVVPKLTAVQDLQDLLALTPLPPPPQPSVAIPAGEARARFVISPEPNPTPTGAEPGSKNGTASAAAGTESRTPTEPAPAPAAAASAGARSGSARNPFAGITIIGGLDTPKTDASATDTAAPAPFQAAWGATIVSTEDSGGGLPRFGVFSGEVHTAYLDMRRTVADAPHQWIFEFGAPTESNSTTNTSKTWHSFVLPFPVIREQPVLPPELTHKYSQRMIIVYAVINVEGKMEEMAVKQTPDPLLNQPALSALSKWIFKPALSDGKAVAAKMLVGIPLR